MLAGILAGTPVLAELNVGFNTGALLFSKSKFFAGDTVKLYSVIVNNEYDKLTGQVGFYDNNQLVASGSIGDLGFEQAKQVSFVWTATPGFHTISATILSASVTVDGTTRVLSQAEINALRGGASVQSSLTVDRDSDHDGIGDTEDTDDDDDGVSDVDEKARGTDPFDTDTDNDGHEDNVDLFPFDAKRYKIVIEDTIQEKPKPQPTPTPAPTPVIKESPKPASTTVTQPKPAPTKVVLAQPLANDVIMLTTSTVLVDPLIDVSVSSTEELVVSTSPKKAEPGPWYFEKPFSLALGVMSLLSLVFALYFWIRSRRDSST